MNAIREKNKGITLIALIITIIILVILTGLTLSIVLDEGFLDRVKGVIGKANQKGEDENAQNEQIQNVWEDQPGKIIKSATKQDSTIMLSAVTSHITRTSFRVNARGTNDKEEILQFTLKVGDTIYETKTGEEVYWDITELEMDTEYPFEVIARDSESDNSVIGKEKTLKNTAPTVTASVSDITASSAKITAIGSDDDGDTLQYKLEVNGNIYENTTGIFDVTGLSDKTTYTYTVTVTDGIESGTETGSFNTLEGNAAPVIVTNTVSDRTTTSIIISAKATDSNGDNLIYKLYTSTSQNGSYALKATSSQIAQNVQTTLTASSLSNYTTYWWYITVSDGLLTTTSSIQSTNTKCPGTKICNTTWCVQYGLSEPSYTCEHEIVECETCGGTGYAPCEGTVEIISFYETEYSPEHEQMLYHYEWECTDCGDWESGVCFSDGPDTSHNIRCPAEGCDLGYISVCPVCGVNCDCEYCSNAVWDEGGEEVEVECEHGVTGGHYTCEHYDITDLESHETTCDHPGSNGTEHY